MNSVAISSVPGVDVSSYAVRNRTVKLDIVHSLIRKTAANCLLYFHFERFLTQLEARTIFAS